MWRYHEDSKQREEVLLRIMALICESPKCSTQASKSGLSRFGSPLKLNGRHKINLLESYAADSFR